MKQFLIAICLLMAFSYTGQAQLSEKYVTLTVSATGDTISQSSADTLYTASPLTDQYMLHFRLKTVKISGTPTGACIVQGSDDNTNWTTCKSYTGLTPSTADTAALTNVATGYLHWYILPNTYTFRYWRIICTTTSTTQSIANTARIYYKEPK